MVLTAAIVGMLHFTLQTLQPYRLLKRGSATARNGMFKYLYSILEAVRDRDYATMLTTTAVFLGFFLTIAISGLYTAQHVAATGAMTVEQTDWFEHHTSLNNSSPLQIESVTVGNLSYPRFPLENLVFPSMDSTRHADGKINLQIPALRGIMNCSVFPSEDIVSINNTWFHGAGWQDVLTILIEDKRNCLHQFMTNELPNPNCNSLSCSELPKRPLVEIDIQELPYVTYDSNSRASHMGIPTTGCFGYLNWQRNWPWCPSSVGVIGKTANHLIEESTFFTCSPFAQKVRVNATFVLPTMDIDQSSPPVITSGSAEQFELNFAHVPEHGAPVAVYPNPLTGFQQVLLPPTSDGEMFGTFMDILVYGTHGIPAAELVGTANIPRLLSGLDHLYGVGFAQLMNG